MRMVRGNYSRGVLALLARQDEQPRFHPSNNGLWEVLLGLTDYEAFEPVSSNFRTPVTSVVRQWATMGLWLWPWRCMFGLDLGLDPLSPC